MNDSPVRTILLPATLIAGTIFSLLATTMVGSKLKAHSEPLTLSSSLPQYTLREQQRNLTIRNVGFCILVSAGAGLAVAGGIRKWHSTQKKTQLKQQAVSGEIAEFLSSRPSSDRLN